MIQWAKEGGVLLIGYELYRQLSLQKARKRRVERKRKLNPDDDIDDEKNKHLLEGEQLIVFIKKSESDSYYLMNFV